MSKKLEKIRQHIDSMDDQIHDLLMERAALVSEISEEKRKSNMKVVQPAREAVMIRRLLARHEGPLPKAAVVRIWRELVGAVSLLQTGLKVAVTVPDDKSFYWDMARDYFGSVLPMQKTVNPLISVSMVREDEATFAVVPWPVDEDTNPWWAYLMSEGEDAMRIVVRLPYGDQSGESPDPTQMALIVAKNAFDATAEDRSFLAIEVDQSVSRARIVDVAKELELTPLSLHSRKCPTQSMPTLHLLEVDEYIGEDDPRLKQITEKLEDASARCLCIGGYPVPPVYKEKESKS